jgi:hypothetical protein
MYRYCRRNGDDYPVCERTYNSRTRTYTANRHANYSCPLSPIVPLTNNQDALLTSISRLNASGNTYINAGMVWGLRVLSPEFPFQEGVEWEDQNWKKAIILMTDGVNQMHPYYSIYGPTADHNIDNGDLDDRLMDVCDELKREDRNVLVYTITFDKGVDEDTKEMFRECATTPAMWYDAPTQAKLIEVYSKIAKELSNLHITR